MAVADDALSIDVIVAARDAAADITACLVPLIAMRERGEIARVIVVDDASRDMTVTLAREAGADQVIGLAQRQGAAGARNVGADEARATWLWFVDADVQAHDNAARVLAATCRAWPIDAVFGSYGQAPTASNFLSQYKNLVHHDTHQRAAGPARTFWTGLGAVRREAFLAIDGFDAPRFRDQGMEDVDFGYRLTDAGYTIRLEPELQGEHRKRWTLINLLRTEIGHRALPWSRLIIAGERRETTLNVSHGERLRALLAGATLVMTLLVLTPALFGLPGLILLAAMWAAVFWANRRLFDFFAIQRGYGFALRAVAFHQIYYLYSAATYVYAWFEYRLTPRRARSSAR